MCKLVPKKAKKVRYFRARLRISKKYCIFAPKFHTMSMNITNNLLIRLLAIVWTACVLSAPVAGQQVAMAQAYQALSHRFDLRQKKDPNLAEDLQSYLKRYPYTTYAEEVHLMSAILLTEKGSYSKAIKEFKAIPDKQVKRLTRPHIVDYYYYYGYACTMNNSYGQAKKLFRVLQDDKRFEGYNPYAKSVTYYLGYCEYRLGNRRQALSLLKQVEADHPKTVPYYITQMYYADHRYDEVVSRAEEILSNSHGSDNDAELHRMLGEIYYQRGDYAQARVHLSRYEQDVRAYNAALKEADKKKGRHLELERNDMYLLGMVAYQLGDQAEAISHLRQVKHQVDTISESTYMTLGNIYSSQGDVAQAKLNYGLARQMKLTPELTLEASYNYALATYQSSGSIGDVTAFKSFLQDYPNTKYTETVYALQCDAYMKSNDKLSALEILNTMPEQSPKVRQTKQYLRYQLGVDAFVQGKMDRAREWMTEVERFSSECDKYTTDALYWNAEASYRLHDFGGCSRKLDAMSRRSDYTRSPNCLSSVYLLGYTQFAQKQYAKSGETFRRYISLSAPDDRTTYDALNRIGDCYFNARDFKQAIASFTRVIDHNATGSDYAMFQRGYAYGLQHNYELKLQDMQTVVARYPKSDYVVRALYEMARAQIALGRESEAIATYDELLKSYSKNPQYGPKASLERAMLYRNMDNREAALKAYKHTISNYPSTEEAYTALAALEALHVELNRVDEYVRYTKKLGNMKVTTREDSLTYVAGELQYMRGAYDKAATTLHTYRTKYGAGSRYYTIATYYEANCHYYLGNKEEACTYYSELADMAGNPYIEEAWLRAAEISYDMENYARAIVYFRRLHDQGSTKDNRNIGRLGVLRCAHFTGNHRAVIDVAQDVLTDAHASAELQQEAHYCRAKAYLNERNFAPAIDDLLPISREARTEVGAESNYLLADAYYQMGNADKAEEQVMAFSDMNTEHEYWLARAILLLVDINIQREEYFLARQYLLALQDNYRGEDDIRQLVTQRMTTLDALDQPEETDEDGDATLPVESLDTTDTTPSTTLTPDTND